MTTQRERSILNRMCKGCSFYQPGHTSWSYKICMKYCVAHNDNSPIKKEVMARLGGEKKIIKLANKELKLEDD